MFDLDHQLVKLNNANFRMEKHGEDNVLAGDLAIDARMPNEVLSMFSSTLKNAIYYRDESVQGELIDDPTHAPNLRNPKLGVLKWDDEYKDMQFRVHHGINDKDDLVFSEAKVDHFKFHCQEGGTVIVSFRVQVHPTELDSAKVLSLINSEVHVSLISEIGDQDEMPEAA